MIETGGKGGERQRNLGMGGKVARDEGKRGEKGERNEEE